MALHNELGAIGEDEAIKYLQGKGFLILHRNWRCGHKELDIVARHQHMLVVVEVKTRQTTRYGMPEDAVDNKKIRRIVASTDAYVKRYSIDWPVRFDIITVIGGAPPYRIEHIEDAFFPPVW